MAIINQEALSERASGLKDMGLNGMKFLQVDKLETTGDKPHAEIIVYFFNAEIIKETLEEKKLKPDHFSISGGQRKPAGKEDGQVKVVEILENSEENSIKLIIRPIGDYSTYTLHLEHEDMDPLFSEIRFKFRPGCFNINCAPGWELGEKPKNEPAIDYLAKDYDSFKHTLITAMMERVPGWQATSEADLDQVLIDLFSAAADELSDYQDRVMNEAYLGTARKRVSLARHARLMDYHIHQGNQASTWLALEITDVPAFYLSPGFLVWTGSGAEENTIEPDSVVFMSKEEHYLDHLLNRMGLYTWSDSVLALAAGSVSADLRIGDGNESDAKEVESIIRNGDITHLLIQEDLDPDTGKKGGADKGKRQLLQLLPGAKGAEAMKDPLKNEWCVRVRWEEKDKLEHNYCFTIGCPGGKIENISFFNGNLVEVFHGKPVEVTFKEPGTILGNNNEYYYERMENEKWGTVCRLPGGPLAYKETEPGGEIPPRSTLELEVAVDGAADPWEEVISLVHSGSGLNGEQGDHFMVETDEEGNSLIRFGNGIHGRELPEEAEVLCKYQLGKGPDGNVGADSLINLDISSFPDIQRVWNPFDVTNGRAPEPVEEIIRRVPEAYRFRQLRAVTLEDYINRAEELPGVSKAAARYAWTGSWRTVQVTIDPGSATTLSDELKEKIARHLEAVRLIGEDIEIRPPRWLPLEIEVSLCAHPLYWPEDIKYILEREFSDGYLPDGRTGFFHPDNWTFGQPLKASQIIGRVQSVQGVDHVIEVKIRPWDAAGPWQQEITGIRPNEILLVKNDPDHMESGSITFFVEGGRR